jgi:hypothetical protein
MLLPVTKDDSTVRILRSCFGFLRTEHYQHFKEHAEQLPIRDRTDGLLYIDNTIEWIIHSVADTCLVAIKISGD